MLVSKKFKQKVKSLSGIWDSDNVIFTHEKTADRADYMPEFPEHSDKDACILMSLSGDGRYAFVEKFADYETKTVYDSFEELSRAIILSREAKAVNRLDCLAEERPGVIELCAFPNDESNYCKIFQVPVDWLTHLLVKLYESGISYAASLEDFLDNYCWEETGYIYEQACRSGVMLYEEEVA